MAARRQTHHPQAAAQVTQTKEENDTFHELQLQRLRSKLSPTSSVPPEPNLFTAQQVLVSAGPQLVLSGLQLNIVGFF